MFKEIKQCQNCKREFTIEPEDFNFYEKIKVPPPTFCSECRNIRRLTWREERTFYRGTCALCGKTIINIHAPDSPFTVYCRPCWNSDKWDPMAYGRDYDFNQPFFLQYRKLMEAVPRPAMTGANLVNSDYAHASSNCKNCYYVFWSYFSENSQYGYGLIFSKDTYDSFTAENSDRVYETLHGNRLYQVNFAYFSDDCLNSSFIFDCVGCSDCFGCVNMRKQKYCLFNQKLSKEEYTRQLTYWDIGSYKKLEEAKEKFRALYLSLPHRYAVVRSSVNVSGDVIRDTKDCQTCFGTLQGVQNCKYIYFGGLNLKDSYDVNAGGDLSELLCEVVGVTRSQQCFFSAGSTNSKNIFYSNWTLNCSDTFGCLAIKNKRYCILNKQYTDDEYQELIPKIKQHMNDMPYIDRRGRVYRLGEFFPTEISAYAYNESTVFNWYPKSKEEVLAEGWLWRDPVSKDYEVSIKAEDLPDHIRDVKDSILEEIIGCPHKGNCNEQCTRAFRLTPQELSFYRAINMALPRLCPNCRYAERLKWRNKFRLFERQCMCGGKQSANRESQIIYANTASHFHGDSLCPNRFQTSFAPERPEIIYCDQCYKSEFL